MLLLFVALPAEAKPFIHRYQLIKKGNIYSNEKMKLIITGMGPFSACSMVERYGSKKDIFVNIGTCGDEEEEIGSLFLAGKLKMDDQYDFPRFAFKTNVNKKTLTTVLTPKETYPENSLVDMEGFGFFKAALNFANREEILLIKIVSDNKKTPFDRKAAAGLIESKLDDIDTILASLIKRKSIDISLFIEKWHFTATEKAILTDLLHNRNETETFDELKTLSNAKDVLNALRKERILTFE